MRGAAGPHEPPGGSGLRSTLVQIIADNIPLPVAAFAGSGMSFAPPAGLPPGGRFRANRAAALAARDRGPGTLVARGTTPREHLKAAPFEKPMRPIRDAFAGPARRSLRARLPE